MARKTAPPPPDDTGARPGLEAGTRCGFVALIGAPNVGKSTLINALVGTKVAIVSHKVQTTRALLRGIAIEGAAQLVFVDTPGIFAPKRRLDRAMVTTAWAGAHDADIVGVLIDARRGIDEETAALLERLKDVRKPKLLILNKIDLVDKPALLTLAKTANEQAKFDATFMISALAGDGVADLKRWLAEHAPEGPWHYPEDQISDAPLAPARRRDHARAALQAPAPGAALPVDGGNRYLEGTCATGRCESSRRSIVERDSQKKIVLGKGGATIKAIGAEARREIAAAIEQKVHLFLFVKVREGWGDDPERYREMGLEFPKE